jgi:hypothetical protein
MLFSRTLTIFSILTIAVVFALPLSANENIGMSQVTAPRLQGYSGQPMSMDKPGQYAAGTIASLQNDMTEREPTIHIIK